MGGPVLEGRVLQRAPGLVQLGQEARQAKPPAVAQVAPGQVERQRQVAQPVGNFV